MASIFRTLSSLWSSAPSVACRSTSPTEASTANPSSQQTHQTSQQPEFDVTAMVKTMLPRMAIGKWVNSGWSMASDGISKVCTDPSSYASSVREMWNDGTLGSHVYRSVVDVASADPVWTAGTAVVLGAIAVNQYKRWKKPRTDGAASSDSSHASGTAAAPSTSAQSWWSFGGG